MGNETYQNMLAYGILLPMFVCSAATIDLPYSPNPIPQSAEIDFTAGSPSWPGWENRSALALETCETTEDTEKIEIITSFARQLVAESQDIDPEYVKVVDKKFWDLM